MLGVGFSRKRRVFFLIVAALLLALSNDVLVYILDALTGFPGRVPVFID